MKVIQYLSLIVASAAMLVFSAPVHASDMDKRIENSAKESHVFKTFLKDGDVKVKSKDGAVTLTGTVIEEFHKDLAAETVGSIAGVKSVDNKLEIKGERHPEMSDMWIMTKVKSTLLYHRSVSGLKAEVVVKNGIVTLQGEADNKAQIDLTTEYARDIEGVKNVINKMTVAKVAKKGNDRKDEKAMAKDARTLGDKIDDASITALVKMSFATHRSTSALRTKVETKDGVVTLSGKANNAAELYLATKLAKDVTGVNDVKNLMTIDK
jgi:osmotically-inducible protein OsmY